MKARVIFLVMTVVIAVAGLGIYALAEPSAAKEEPMPETTLIIGADPHYIAPALTDHGEYFENMITNADGKVMDYIEELTDAFFAEVTAAKPDALILPGDISFNGARLSHEALAEKLRAVTAAGIPVLVMPGNHDIESTNAAVFHGATFTRIESVTPEEFAEIYADMGYGGALSRDAASLSYMYAVSDKLRVLMLDVNMPDSVNVVQSETLAWAEEQLRAARDEGARVVAVSHQNLFRHNSVIYRGYVMENADAVLALYKKYGVIVNFTGHLHCQHIAHDGAFYEIATSSLAVSPNQYGVAMLAGDTLDYETRPVDVSAWARERGLTDPNLLDFSAYSLAFFKGSGRIPEAESELLTFFTELNAAYFSGRLDLVRADDPMFDRWGEAFGFEGQYIMSIRDEAGLDSTRLTLHF